MGNQVVKKRIGFLIIYMTLKKTIEKRKRKRSEIVPDHPEKMKRLIERKIRNDRDLEKRVKKIKRRTKNVPPGPKVPAQDQNLQNARLKKRRRRGKERKKRGKLRKKRGSEKKKNEKENKESERKKR